MSKPYCFDQGRLKTEVGLDPQAVTLFFIGVFSLAYTSKALVT